MNFSKWVHESTDRWNPNAPTRGQLISKLFLNVIHPILTSAGYSLCYTKHEMLNKFATFIHVIEREHYYNNQHTLIVPQALHRDEQIDRDNWYLTFNDEIWYNISRDEQWTGLFRSDMAASYFWAVLSQVLYRYIDIVNSKTCNKYDAEEAELYQLEYEWMVEQGLIVVGKGDEFTDKPMGKYYD